MIQAWMPTPPGDLKSIWHMINGTQWRSWLRHCAPSRKVTGSIPVVVTGIFHWHKPSGHTMDLGLTHTLTEMSTKNISWGGKGGRWVGLSTLPPPCAKCREIWELQPPGTLRTSGPVQACNGIALPLYTIKVKAGHVYNPYNSHFSIYNHTVTFICRYTHLILRVSVQPRKGLNMQRR